MYILRFSYFLFAVLLLSCDDPNHFISVKNNGNAQGTYYHIEYISENGIDFQNEIDSILNEVDKSLSTYNAYSTISLVNNDKTYKTDSLFNIVFSAAKKVYQETDGAFDCTVSPIVNSLGFGFTKKNVSIDSVKIKELLSFVDFSKVVLTEDSIFKPKGMSLDFNAIAQGFSIDLISKFLEYKGCFNYIIELGGELRVNGVNSEKKPWRVGIENPFESKDLNHFSCIMEIKNNSLATSGNYRRFFQSEEDRYTHIVNPFNGDAKVNELLSVSVIHNDCMFADAYATAFMVIGLEKSKKLAKKLGLSVYIIYKDINNEPAVYYSSDLKKTIIN